MLYINYLNRKDTSKLIFCYIVETIYEIKKINIILKYKKKKQGLYIQ